MNENDDDCHHRKTTRTFIYIHKKQKKLRNVFIYKNPETFQKLDNFRYVYIYISDTLYVTGFAENFEVDIYIEKA